MSCLTNKSKLRTWCRSLKQYIDCLLERALLWLVIIVEFDDPGIIRDHQNGSQQTATEPGCGKIESGSL